MKPRLATIAEAAGVSEATVSRVLNGQPGPSQATREKVLQAVDMLGYERPAALRQRSAGLVGLIVPELHNLVFPRFAQVIEDILSRQHFTPVLCTQTPGGVSEDDYIAMLLERNVSGIIFVSGAHASVTADHERYHRLRARNLPIVMINGYVADIDAPFVSCDDAAAISLPVQHLHDLGHRRIGLAIGPGRYTPVIRKVASFDSSMRSIVGESDPTSLIATTDFSVDGGDAAARQLVDRGCTAIICGSDMMALGAIRALRALGLDVPRDVSVVGFDNSPMLDFTDPPLTSVHQPVEAMGAVATTGLIDEIAGKPAPRAEMIFRPELVVRESTAPVNEFTRHQRESRSA